jgi:predicted ATP-dependent serine protease
VAFTCIVCGAKTNSSPPPLLCDGCGRADTYVDVGASAATAQKGATRYSLADDAPPVCYVSTRFADVDALLDGGFALGTTTLVYGARGSGKSTWCLRVAAGCARTLDGAALVVCPEMSHAILARTATRAGAELERLIRCRVPEEWESEVARDRVLLVDSLSKMRDPLGTLERVVEWARQRSAIAICLAHQTRAGDAMGGAGLEHDVDAVFRITHDEHTHERRLYIEKSRTAPVGELGLDYGGG